jgi:hypothetical protein
LAGPVIVSSCSVADNPAATAYITIDPAQTARYMKDLADIARAQDLGSWSSSETRDDGPALFVFEAKGRALRIWSQNVLLSGHECPKFPNAGNDPGQFKIVVTPSMWFRTWDRAHELFGKVRDSLVAKGYPVTSVPSTPCAPDRPKIALAQ